MADNSLAVQQQGTQLAKSDTFAPRNLMEAIEFAKLIADSGMVPKDYIGKPGAIVLAFQMGAEVGLAPIQALQSISVINNRAALWGDGALAIVMGHPDFVSIEENDIEAIKKNGKATCILKRRGRPDKKVTFSLEDAKTAGLIGKSGPWTTAPSRMLQMRARAFAMRDQFPDALKGIKTVEEVRDYGDTIEGTVTTSSATATASAPAEEKIETIGQVGGSAFYKAYRASGWTPAEAKAFLAEALQIGEPHNKQDSRDIPVSEWSEGGRAFVWAHTASPVRAEAERRFEILGLNKEESIKFHAEHKGDWAAICDYLGKEIEKRDAQERGE